MLLCNMDACSICVEWRSWDVVFPVLPCHLGKGMVSILRRGKIPVMLGVFSEGGS